MNDSNRIGGLFFSLFGTFILVQSLEMRFGTLRRPESGFFPSIVSILFLVLSLILLLGSFRKKDKKGVDFGNSFIYISITTATMVFYALFINALGYLLCTFITGVILFKIVQKQGWRRTISYSALYALISYFGFKAFGGVLPQGVIPYV